MKIIETVKESMYKLFELQEQQRELQKKLLAAIYIKEYKIKNPEKDAVLLATYYIKDLTTKEISRFPEYKCFDYNNPNHQKKIDQLKKKYFSKAHNLEIKSYSLKNIEIKPNDKMLKQLHQEILEALTK